MYFLVATSKIMPKFNEGRFKRTHGHSVRSEGRGVTRTYRTWSAIKERCFNIKSKDYPTYGGRGIELTERWLNFENFLLDMGARPEGCSIDRIDNEGNYEPDNCRWSTLKEQGRNKRNNHMVEYLGVIMSLIEWSEKTGIPKGTLCKRLNYPSWTIKEALTLPILKKPRRCNNE